MRTRCDHCRKRRVTYSWTLTACADHRATRKYRLCRPCDIELNHMALNYFNDPQAAEKIEAYANRKD